MFEQVPVGPSAALSPSDNTRRHVLSWLNTAKLDKPAKFSGESGEHAERSRRLRGFLPGMQRYLLVTGLKKDCWGLVGAHFLEGAALDVWELELDTLQEKGGLIAVTWGKFESCLTGQFASLMPAREARSPYDQLTQQGSVADYVTAFRQSLRELTGSHFNPGGSALFDFIKGPKPAVCTHVQDSAREGWYQSVEQAFCKAQDWEYNKQAAVEMAHLQRSGSHRQRNSSPSRQLDRSTDSNSKNSQSHCSTDSCSESGQLYSSSESDSEHSKGDKQPSSVSDKRRASNQPQQGSAKRARQYSDSLQGLQGQMHSASCVGRASADAPASPAQLGRAASV